MIGLSERLTQRLDVVRSFPVGISADDVKKIALDEILVDDILACLRSSQASDQSVALFFAEVLIWKGSLCLTREREFVAILKTLISNKKLQIHAASVKMLTRFRSLVPEYRSLMLSSLADTEAMVRKEALLAFATFGSIADLAHLDRFESDEYIAETRMGGPLIYELRNLALTEIEATVGKSFRKHEMSEMLGVGHVVYWWSWAEYKSWRKKRVSSFWLRCLDRILKLRPKI